MSGKLKGDDDLQATKKELTQIKPKMEFLLEKRKRTMQTSRLVLLVPGRHEE